MKSFGLVSWIYIFLAILTISGFCFILTWPLLFDCLLNLQCNPILFYKWKYVPVDLRTEFFFFNWTNPEDIYNKSVKPKFKEIGPYVFLQREKKVNIVWNQNGTVTYQQRKFWYYDKSVKNGNLQENVTSLSVPILAISYITRNWNYYVRKGIFLSLRRLFSEIQTTHTAAELLFDGYPESLIKIASALPFFTYLKIPAWDRFGWMYARNGTEFDGVFNMGTGTNSVLGQVYQWNYRNRTDFFESKCGEVSGSAGQFFPRNLNRSSIVIFSTDLSRKLSFEFAGEKKVKNILGYQFTGGDLLMDDGSVDPENKCFCAGERTPKGIMNVTLTRSQFPVFPSLPHFYNADPYYVNSVEGLSPEKEKHEFVFTVEPTTGIVLEGSAKVQANLLIQPVTATNMYENAPRIFFPIMWTRQTVTIPDMEAFMLKIVLAMPVMSYLLGSTMMVIGIGLIYYKAIIQKRIRCKEQFSHKEEGIPLNN